MMYKLSQIALISIFTFIVATFIIQFYPVTVIKANQPYKVLQTTVQAGGQLTYIVDACKYFSVESTVYRTYVDNARYPTIISNNNIKKGCNKTKITVLVPNYLPPDKYHLELDVVYKVNPFRSQTYHFKTEDFYVVPSARQVKVDELLK